MPPTGPDINPELYREIVYDLKDLALMRSMMRPGDRSTLTCDGLITRKRQRLDGFFPANPTMTPFPVAECISLAEISILLKKASENYNIISHGSFRPDIDLVTANVGNHAISQADLDKARDVELIPASGLDSDRWDWKLLAAVRGAARCRHVGQDNRTA